nr:hypothetical protein [Tanacetum cinerariifolium]
MLLCKQESKGITLSAEHNEWLQDTDEELDGQELETCYMYKEKIQEVLHVTDNNSGPTYDAKPLEKVHTDDDYNLFATKRQHSIQPESINDTVDSNVNPDSTDMCNNEGKDDQNAKEPENERNNDKVLKVKNDSLITKINNKTIEINDLKAQLQDKTIVNVEMHALPNKAKGKYVDTKFEKPSVVRQPNAFRFQNSSVLGKPSPFSNYLERQFIPKSRGKENKKLLINLVLNGPFKYGTVTIPGTATTPATGKDRTYNELIDAEKIHERCDIKATNIVLQGLPQDIYNLVNHHTEAKDIWDRVKLLIEGSEISLQERESKLYDEFNMFTLVPGETIHTFYLRFAQLINDMHSIGMGMIPIQINTKFINQLQLERSKFVTDVKLAKDLHITNFDHMYGYLRQHEAHTKEVRLIRQRYSNPIALVANTSNSSPSYSNQSHYHQQLSPFAQHYYSPPVTCTKPKRPRNSALFREKAMLAEALKSGVALDEEQMAFLVDNGDTFTTCQASQELVTIAAFQTNDLDAFDSNCDEVPSAITVLMAKLSTYDSDILSELLTRLVAQGYTQEEGINYDEVFAHVARIKAIRLFLAYVSFKDFVVYQIDVKSAFLYGKIEEEVYVCQPPGFEDLNFPDRVYKVEKVLYRLHQASRACSTKKEICNAFEKLMHEKFQMSSIGELTFFLGLQPLLKDEDGEEVDVHMYRSMISSLMYLTSSRPDIMFAVCVHARYQVNPKVSHLHVVKRIFRYLKGQPKLGLWYTKDSLFDLVAYTDSDYAGISLDRKSTTGGCQFLGRRLKSWQCKKQTVVANSTTKAKYVAASSCCEQVLWIQNQLLDYGFVQVFLDKHVDGVSNYERKYISPSHTKKIFRNTRRARKGFSERITPLLPTMVVQSELGEGLAMPADPHYTPTILQSSSSQPQKTHKPKKPTRKVTQVPQPRDPMEHVADEAIHKKLGDSSRRAATIASSLGAEQDNGNINKTQSKATTDESSSKGTDLGGGPRVLELEKTNTSQHNEIASLKRRVKKLKKRIRSRNHKLKRLYNVGFTAWVESSDDEESLGKDASKQERRIDAIDQDKDITLVNVQDDAEMFDVNDLVNAAQDSSATTTITTEELTLAQALKALKTSKPKVKGIVIQEQKEPGKSTTAATIPKQQSRDKDKGIMIEEPLKPKKKDQIRFDEKAAKRLQAQEQKELSNAEKATLFQQLLEKRRKHFAAKRAEEKKNKPPTQAQKRKITCTYLKNMEGYKLKYLNLKEFDKIQEMFDGAFKRVNTFKDIRTELVKGKEKRAGEELIQEVYMLVEKTYLFTPPTLSMMLEKKLQIDYQSEMAYQLFKLIKKQLKK